MHHEPGFKWAVPGNKHSVQILVYNTNCAFDAQQTSLRESRAAGATLRKDSSEM